MVSGLLFLPAAGYRSGVSVASARTWGCYPSRSALSSPSSMRSLVFHQTRLSVGSGDDYWHRVWGRSVRLVCLAQ